MTATSRSWFENPFLEREDWKNTNNTPNYWALKSAGLPLPDNIFARYGEWKYYDDLRGDVSIWNGEKYVNTGTYFYRPSPVGFQLPAFLWDGPNQALLEKVKTDSIGIMTMYAERVKTANLLKEFMGNTLYTLIHWKKPVKVLRRWLKDDQAVRKWATKKLHRRIARCTTPADAWLEYRYAYRPLMYDVKDALSAFKKGEKKQHIFRINVKGERTGSTTAENLGPVGNIRGTCNSEEKFYIGARFKVVDPSLAALGNLSSFAAGLWDVIPLSFVIDWAWDISSYLDLQNATLGLEFISGFRSQKIIHNRSYSQYFRTGFARERYTPSEPYRASWRSEYFERSIMTSCPTPTVMVGSAAEIFKTAHLVDIVAIIRSIWMGTYRNTYYFTD